MTKHPVPSPGKPRHGESGQVLLLGVVMMTMLLLLILYAFDIHNVIRAKFKTETAQEAAALAGARWQRESLNLIGEINVLKVCELLMTGNETWSTPLPDREKDEEAYLDALQARMDLLTEMQTRISFIGPVVGFAAAQQAAKANGLAPIGNSGQTYLELLNTSWRYRELYGGAPEVIHNYRWRESYTGLVEAVVNNGIAVYPNARMAHNGTVDPSELGSEALYNAIRRHAQEIAAGDPPPRQSSWKDELYRFVKYWRQGDFDGKWWKVDYSLNAFPGESEIFTLGVQTEASRYSDPQGNSANDDLAAIDHPQMEAEAAARGRKKWSAAEFPVLPEFFCYDNTWYPEYYRARYSDYDENHYNYWFDGDVLRNPVKTQYRYEGPAAYVEGAVDVGRVVRHRVKRHNFRDRKGFLADGANRSAARVGSRRDFSSSETSGSLTEYRPGTVAKVFGSLGNNRPPIEIPVILPVFDRIALVPTYMPIPYGFGVLRPENSPLTRFLEWLAGQNDLNGTPPPGTEGYLDALRILCDGPKFRYYGWNPDFDAEAFNNSWKSRLKKWHRDRDKYIYSRKQTSGPGWLQEPKRFSKGTPTEEIALLTDNQDGTFSATDRIHGGKATVVFLDANKSSYYVIASTGKIVTNDDGLNPVLLYNNSVCDCNGGDSVHWNSGVPDSRKGPARL